MRDSPKKTHNLHSIFSYLDNIMSNGFSHIKYVFLYKSFTFHEFWGFFGLMIMMAYIKSNSLRTNTRIKKIKNPEKNWFYENVQRCLMLNNYGDRCHKIVPNLHWMLLDQ